MPRPEFAELRAELNAGGVAAVLDRLANQLRQQKKYPELFEALKMRVRHRLGLPLLYSDTADALSDEQRRQLEDGLIEACREVGLLLLSQGQIHSGWMYLRPVGEKGAVAEALAKVEVDEDNLEEFVEVALHEGVDPVRGYGAVLEHYGTCNAITVFESILYQRSKADQQAAAALLVEHVHRELTATLIADISGQEGSDPPETTIADLVRERDWLFGEGSYHIDTTHLAATVRFARIIEDPAALRLALDLTEYGRRLSSQFQYQGEEPFADIYPSHALFFQALLGENVQEAVDYFRQKAEDSEIAAQGSAAAEVYVSLLSRLGRHDEAIEASVRLLPPGTYTQGVAPSLLELAQRAGKYDRLVEIYEEREDLLGFATGLVSGAAGNGKK